MAASSAPRGTTDGIPSTAGPSDSVSTSASSLTNRQAKKRSTDSCAFEEAAESSARGGKRRVRVEGRRGFPQGPISIDRSSERFNKDADGGEGELERRLRA